MRKRLYERVSKKELTKIEAGNKALVSLSLMGTKPPYNSEYVNALTEVFITNPEKNPPDIIQEIEDELKDLLAPSP